MFCNQCEQTSKGIACTTIGVCGKSPEVAGKQDELVAALIGLARAAEGKKPGKHADELVMEGLFATLTNVNFDPARFDELNKMTVKETATLGTAQKYDANDLFKGDTDVVSLRSTLLYGLKGMAAYAWHAHVLGKDNPEVTAWFYKGLREAVKDHSVDEWLGLIMEFGQVNLKCMALLDEANTSTFGHPVPTKVSLKVEKGPFIVISGHDLLDLKQLLEQTEGKGINIYTHGEMLPAHAYPGLKKFSHLKGNFGTAWQNQQHELTDAPGAIVFTTNCLMLPKNSYRDNVFTTSIVGCRGRHAYCRKRWGKRLFPGYQAVTSPGWMERGQAVYRY